MSGPARVVLAVGLLCACSRAPERGEGGSQGRAAGDAARGGGEVPAPDNAEPLVVSKSVVTLWFPSASGDALVSEAREIVDTVKPQDRGTQILSALIDGPTGNEALPAVPAGTTLRQLWVRPDGVAYADFSAELAHGMAGGSDDELLAVYSIVNSLAANVPSIRRVAILVDGRERDTLGGHVDVRRPLSPDRTLQTAAAPAAR